MRANPTEVDESRIKHVLKAISQYDQLACRHQCCFVHGMGGQKRNFFADLARETGSELVWSGSILPRWIRFIGAAIPSTAGLLRLETLGPVEHIFTRVCDSGMAGIYIFDTDLESEFVRRVTQRARLAEIDGSVERDPAAFIYQIDSNNPSSKTDNFEFLYLGPKFSPDIRRLIHPGGDQKPA